ncbi:hypothetical protein [Streptococcus sobrinus]|uniref:Uncharacterized protein n=2 Tax=Streptococcus sobrinus TaxID=1310 RepID=U2KC74_9STRE|nr:hypothetical protein [Streptococcus sobrinus]AWN61492.1 hypothetical protein DLJ52_04405 [Streptococcus sobrinus]AWN63365.1 hypothetical protein DLJ51_04405 [Streptococcus sobrinus]ERJ74759.1 hypothetical protein HMPREF1557_01460 [Streptococcus sobrinus W1703]SQG19816.1 Uncharacterised protein [Streptococcus sobrinus]
MKVVAKCLAWLLGYLFLQALTNLFLPFIYLTLTSGDFADLSTRLILISSPLANLTFLFLVYLTSHSKNEKNLNIRSSSNIGWITTCLTSFLGSYLFTQLCPNQSAIQEVALSQSQIFLVHSVSLC